MGRGAAADPVVSAAPAVPPGVVAGGFVGPGLETGPEAGSEL